jgi:hypothetical protein
MAKGKKSWKEKLENGKEPVVGVMNRTISGVPSGGLMLIPTPQQVETYIRSIPKGVSKTPQEMAAFLAKEASADVTCPMCTGIFVRIVAEAAHEEMVAGKKDVAPFWRIIPPKAKVRQKLTFGDAIVDEMRKSEELAV